MYSEQLEALIKSIIADGKITDKERAVLHKRAEAEGIDADEIDVYIDGRLTELGGLIIEHPLNLFTKEIYEKSECYKFKKNYRFDRFNNDWQITTYIQFVHLIEWDDISQKKQKKYDGIALFIATDGYVSMFDDHILSFSSHGQEIVRVTRNYDFFSMWKVPEKQEFDGIKLHNIGFGIDTEQIKALCDATNLSISVNHSVIPKTEIIGFEYLAQRFYKENFDSTAYPNCEEREEAANAAANAARLTNEKEVEKRRKRKELSDFFKNKKVIGCLVFIILLIICFIIAIFG